MIQFISTNKNKFEELRLILPELEMLKGDLVEIQSDNLREVVEFKLKEGRRLTDKPFMVEDSALELSCLNGMPGPFIKWFQDALQNVRLVELTERLKDKAATFIVGIGFVDEEGGEHYFESSLQGTIEVPRGELGFGFNPIFQPNGYDKTYGEMTKEEKNKISPRGAAAQRLADYLKDRD